jgi:putative transposase
VGFHRADRDDQRRGDFLVRIPDSQQPQYLKFALAQGFHQGRGLDQALTLTALNRALADRVPEIHHSDQGVQYAASAYVDLLQAQGVQISMAEVGEPTQNGYAERLIRTIREEEIDLSEYADYYDAYQQIGRFLEDGYMRKRVHQSLRYLTPVEFEQQWCRATALAADVV